MSDWRHNASYSASSAVGDGRTELWFGPVEAMRNGSFVSLHVQFPGDEHPKTLLITAAALQEIIDAPHATRRTLHGETYRQVAASGDYL